ncbi:MAG: DNA-3-methyladenine glycosylase [Roseivirga sp.]|nr:DNA-3-methyladenine glycosylase [Roseivirga sp.]
MKLKRDFYERTDVVSIAKDLLGKTIITSINGQYTAGRITELEAYAGRDDKACHANDGLRTKRTEVMYGRGGMAYVYLCYGIHHLFNVVTNSEGLADAILIRAIEPLEGLDIMQVRRKKQKLDKTLSSGPGTLSAALGIKTKMHYGTDLLGDTIWIDEERCVPKEDIIVSTRIGVDYAEEDALKPWRFYIRDSKWVSKKLTEDRGIG